MSDNQKIDEALNLLSEAAREKKEEVQNLLNNKFTNVRDFIQETAEKQGRNWNRIRRQAEGVMEDGSERLKQTASEIDEKVHENPWPYIGGVALGALLLGFILGSSRRDR
jgi:ElaB/YqjD/DUF883 family membrane-anchored ribosome-binding protein